MKPLTAGQAAGMLLLGLVVGMGIGSGGLFAEDQPDRATRSNSSRPASAASPKDNDTAALENKIDELRNGQQAILKRLDEGMEELRILKIRCTR